MVYISNNKIRQKEDDQHAMESGSMQGYPITPVSEDSPSIVSEVSQGKGVQKTIEPVNNGTRDGYYDVTSDKDQNLHTQFVKPNAID